MTENQPRILLVGNFLSRAGFTPQVCESLSSLFRVNGWEVRTASDKVSRPHRLFDILKTIIAERKHYDVAVIDTFSGAAFWFACLAASVCRVADKPYVLLLHGGNLPDFLDGCATNLKSSLDRFLSPHPLYRRGQAIPYRGFFRRAARLVSPSPYLAAALSERGFEVQQIANAIDLSIYDFRPRFSVRPKIFWLRSFSEIYNPVLALEVLLRLKRDFPDATLTMAGPDKGALETCKRFAERAGVADAVRFPGLISKDEINILAQEHDIFLNTTNVDNAPVSLIEAMALGLPIVTTNVGGLPYLVRDGETALLVPPGDPSCMSAAIMRLISEDGMALKLSQNGRKVAENSSSERVCRQWLELFKSFNS